MYRKISSSDIAAITRSELIGENVEIHSVTLCEDTAHYNNAVTYLSELRYIGNTLKNPSVKAAFITPDTFNNLSVDERSKLTCFITNDPISALYSLHIHLYENSDFYKLPENKSPVIGNNCDIHPSSSIEENVTIGDWVYIGPNVSVLSETVIGDAVRIEANTSVGADGLHTRSVYGSLTHIPHVGRVVIGARCHIGSNSVIEKGLFDHVTSIGEECQIDSLVHIAHGIAIGKRCIIAAGVITSGDAKIGDNVFIGSGAVIRGRLNIGNNTRINIGAVVVEDIPEGANVAGVYSMPNDAWLAKTLNDKRKYLRQDKNRR